MVIGTSTPITVELSCDKDLAKNMDTTTKDNSGKPSNDSTLYNFGYAPKEVIERFQYFCYQYPSLSEAIKSLLDRDKLLKSKYRFMTPPVTYQMLAKPTVNDQPNSVRIAMLSLHKYMKQNRYKSVADAIEELLFGIKEPTDKMRSVGVNTFDQLQDYTMISKVEHETLCKIADVLLLKLQQKYSPSTGVWTTVRGKKTSKTEFKPNKNATAKCYVPKEKKPKSWSPKDKLKFKTSSPVRQKQKSRKVLDDPEYFPEGTRKCLWSKYDNESKQHIATDTNIIFKQQHLGTSVDVEILTPLCRHNPKHIKLPCKSQLSLKHNMVMSELNTDKSVFMMNNLGLIPQTAMNVTSQISPW